MKFRASISLKGYRHTGLIAALKDVAPNERGAFLSDLAAEAISTRLKMQSDVGATSPVGMLPLSTIPANAVSPAPHTREANSKHESSAEKDTSVPVIGLGQAQIAAAFATPRRPEHVTKAK